MTENDYGGRGVSARLAILRDVSRDREVYCVHDINSAFRGYPPHHVRDQNMIRIARNGPYQIEKNFT